ncbi:MAG TPA: TolC family protein [Puia sp.]|nr:TolC family protein [Puia sp.]
MKRYSSWIFIFIFISHVSGYSQDSTKYLSIKQCVDLAIKNNLLVQQSEIQLATNGVAFKQSKENLLPQINGSISQGMNYGRSVNTFNNTYIDEQNSSGNYSLSGNLVLFNGLQLQNAIRQNALFYNASKMDLQQQKDNITLQVINAYLTVLSNKEALEIAIKQASVDSAQVARLQIQNQEGAIPPATLYDLKGQYATDLVNVVNSVNALETSKVNLFALLNVSYQRDATFEMVNMNADISDLNNSSDTIYQTALQTIPTIKANDLRVQSFQKSIAVMRGKLWPTLYLFGNLNSNYTSIATNTITGSTPSVVSTGEFVTVGPTTYDVSSNSYPIEKTPFGDQVKNNRYQSFGLGLNIPILNYFSARNNVKIAKLNYQNARVISDASHNQLQQMVEQAWQNLKAAYGQYKGYVDQVNAYGESFRTAEIRFNEGVITSVDYVIAKNNVDRANLNLVAARYNYIFRTKILEYYQGRLSF